MVSFCWRAINQRQNMSALASLTCDRAIQPRLIGLTIINIAHASRRPAGARRSHMGVDLIKRLDVESDRFYVAQ
jgi:hypothetical protein